MTTIELSTVTQYNNRIMNGVVCSQNPTILSDSKLPGIINLFRNRSPRRRSKIEPHHFEIDGTR